MPPLPSTPSIRYPAKIVPILTTRHGYQVSCLRSPAGTRSGPLETGAHGRITGARVTVLHGRSPLLLSRESRSGYQTVDPCGSSAFIDLTRRASGERVALHRRIAHYL